MREDLARNEGREVGRSQELQSLGSVEFILRMIGNHWRVYVREWNDWVCFLKITLAAVNVGCKGGWELGR